MISFHLLAILVAVVLLQATTILSTTPAKTEYVSCDKLDVLMRPSYVSEDDIRIQTWPEGKEYNGMAYIRPDASRPFDTPAKEVEFILTIPEADLATFKLKDPKGVDYFKLYYSDYGPIESEHLVDGVSDKPYDGTKFRSDSKVVFVRNLKATLFIIFVSNKNPGRPMRFKVELKVCNLVRPCNKTEGMRDNQKIPDENIEITGSISDGSKKGDVRPGSKTPLKSKPDGKGRPTTAEITLDRKVPREIQKVIVETKNVEMIHVLTKTTEKGDYEPVNIAETIGIISSNGMLPVKEKETKLEFVRGVTAVAVKVVFTPSRNNESMEITVEIFACFEKKTTECKAGQKWYAPAKACFPSLTIRTRGGNAHFAYCAIPYKYKGKWVATCVPGKYGPWCGTTHAYDKDGKWGYCAAKCQTHDKKTVYEGDTWTSGGILYVCQKNGKAKKSNCHFPFTYEGLVYENKCAGLYHPWCYTDKDHKKREYCS